MINPAKKTILPADPDDLICDTCPERFPYAGDMFRTFERARVRGWHIYQHIKVEVPRTIGEPVTTVDTRILCPACIGTPRSRPEPAPLVLEGQADILADLDITVEPVEKEKKQPKRGIN
jgi:hypothetical protein